MNKIVRIARLELGTLFYSPIAWLVLIIFIFQSGLTFTGLFDRYASMQTIGFKPDSYTFAVFVDLRSGFFRSIVKNLYLYIPLLTMGLMSRELSSGSVKLLFSSPVKIREIILGKFLSMLVYSLLLIVVLAMFGIAACYSIYKMDVLLFISGLAGIYLLICAYSAIGLFMSCLTSYQVVAAISTLAIFAALNFIGSVWQNIDFVRDITYFLSIGGRTEEMINGLVRSNDVLYFIIVIAIFLGLSYLKLLHDREPKRTLVKTLRYAGFIVVMLLTGYITSLQSLRGYIDMTANNRKTLTRSSQDIIKQMDKPVTITAYVNLLDQNAWLGLPANVNMNKRIFEQFSRFKPGIEVNYVYFYDSIPGRESAEENSASGLEKRVKRMTEAFKFDLDKVLTPAQLRKQVDLLPENNRMVFRIDYNGKQTWLRMFDDNLVVPSEQEIAAALKRLMIQSPKVVFVTGHLSRSIFNEADKDYKAAFRSLNFRKSLINQGFDVDTVNLLTGNIPDSTAVLVIADPRTPFSTEESAKLNAWINRGGNLFVAAKAGRQTIVNPLLQLTGVQLREGTPMQFSQKFPADFMTPHFGKPVMTDSAVSFLYMKNATVAMAGSAELVVADTGVFHYAPLLVTDSSAWNRPVNGISDTTLAVFDAGRGDVRRQMLTAAAAFRTIDGKEQRIVVIGSADFISNGEIERQDFQKANFPFNMNIFSWFADKKFPIDVSRAGVEDSKLLIVQDQVIWLQVIFVGLLPGLLAIFAGMLLIRRRRQ